MVTDQQDTFISHLIELRERLIKALLSIGIVFIALFYWSGDIYDLLAYPMLRVLPEGTRMIATGVVTPFLVPMKITLLVSLFVALPYVLYQIWAFVAPGLYEHEKKLVLPLIFMSSILFFMGVAFCYFFVFGAVFRFVYRWAPHTITVAPDIEQYLSFAMTMFLAFGVTFQVPVAVVILVRAGVVSLQQLKSFRRYFIVAAFIVAAIVTPPDVLSQCLLAIPLCLLFEVGLIMARTLEKRTREAGTEVKLGSDS
jgi:sec-independent protein translocase protein TatC